LVPKLHDALHAYSAATHRN